MFLVMTNMAITVIAKKFHTHVGDMGKGPPSLV